MKNSVKYSAAALFIILPFILLSCHKDSEVLPIDPVHINLTADQVLLIDSGNSFAFDIFKKVAANEGDGKNLLISPLSISTALSMTLNGANGETLNGMIEALRSGSMTRDKINESYKSLTPALLTVDKRVAVSIANSVWAEKTFPVKVPFKNTLTNYYNAEARSFDILDPKAPDAVNNWIEGKTNGLIKNMVQQLDPQTVMLLINAIYFKGQWNSQFEKSKTTQEDFHVSADEVKQVPMMKQKNKFDIYTDPNFTVAEFPYGQGNYVMDVILPGEINGLNSLIQGLTRDQFNQWLEGMRKEEIELSFPKFKYLYRKSLNDILSDMGMAVAFTDAADFSNIADARLQISEVLHQAFIETNEEGTEAAAATVVTIIATAMPTGPRVLNIDHPFLYIIREKTTNTILFMGRVSNPLEN